MPQATIRPWSMMPTRSHSRSTSSSSWLEKMTGTPASACSRSTPLITSTATGSSPANGSSRTSMSGPKTSAAASWMRCWLPRLSAWSSASRRSARPKRSSQPRARLARLRARHAVQLAEVGQLLRHAHLRDTGRAPRACSRCGGGPRRSSGMPEPAHRAGVGREDAEHDPHRRRLAGAVAPDEPEQLARADLEREVLHGDGLPVPLRDPVDLELPWWRCGHDAEHSAVWRETSGTRPSRHGRAHGSRRNTG